MKRNLAAPALLALTLLPGCTRQKAPTPADLDAANNAEQVKPGAPCAMSVDGRKIEIGCGSNVTSLSLNFLLNMPDTYAAIAGVHVSREPLEFDVKFPTGIWKMDLKKLRAIQDGLQGIPIYIAYGDDVSDMVKFSDGSGILINTKTIDTRSVTQIVDAGHKLMGQQLGQGTETPSIRNF
jgi:hypothetical protein